MYIYTYTYLYRHVSICISIHIYIRLSYVYTYDTSSWKRMLNHVANADMGWLRQVGSIKLLISFAKEPYKRDYILHKRPTILSILLTKATPYPLKKRIYAQIYGVSNLM